MGSAGAAVFFATVRPWLLGLSVVLLAIGFAQLYLGPRACTRRTRTSVLPFWGAVSVGPGNLIAFQQAFNNDVLVVWEPILPTDWRAPSTFALSRIGDPRAIQFWDEPHVIARALRDVSSQPSPNCCDRSGILWDAVAVYPPGARWTTSPPPAVFFDGAVVQVQPALTQAIRGLGDGC